MKNTKTIGHISALLTILIWGTTFISTKILLQDFKAIEILFYRFIIGFIVLILIYPKRMKIEDRRQELTFMAADFCGICLYYLLENIALGYTTATNVGIIISVAPLFTALLTHFIDKEKLHPQFFIGFLIALLGIFLVTFQGREIEIHPIGDVLALIAAFTWACYSLLTRKISTFGYSTIQSTRRIFMYGIVFMIPCILFMDFTIDIYKFTNITTTFNILFLGVGASALGFVLWNLAVKSLGTLKTSIYIYLVPVITIITAVVILHESLTLKKMIGIILSLVGLFISNKKN
ncbi:MAG: DMT family transporter [Coprobacillaceae bacterium]